MFKFDPTVLSSAAMMNQLQQRATKPGRNDMRLISLLPLFLFDNVEIISKYEQQETLRFLLFYHKRSTPKRREKKTTASRELRAEEFLIFPPLPFSVWIESCSKGAWLARSSRKA